ncbi:MAG: PEGA domain-containing protein [Myxococcota bacterium]|nr:PEGA domain-containing protein [Myxococcota bacterium]
MKKPIPFGKYLLLERVNVGGMAEVFKAKAFGVEGFERLVAVKRILPSIAEDQEFITMFIDEAKIAVQLTHANVASIFDLGRVADSYFIAMEFVRGKDLRAIFDRVRKRGETVPVPMACYVIMKVCEGLDYAHNKKDSAGRDLHLVHRDVSPQNILLSYDGEVKLIDFGIAKAANKAGKTQAGILKGKFGYMSPEQVRGLPLDRRSDIFSVGIVLYELLTGERLFVGESDFSTLEKVRNVEIMPPSTYNRKIPEELEQIVLKALAKDVEDRYQTAMDLHDDLQSFMYTSGNFFARKDLAAYQKKAFSDEIAKEEARDEQYQQIKAPNPSGLDAFDDLPPKKDVSRPPAPPSMAAGNVSKAPPPPPPRPQPPKATLLGLGAAAPAPPPLPPKPAAGPDLDMDWDDDELATQIYDTPGMGKSSPGAVAAPDHGPLLSAPTAAPAPSPRGAPSPFDAPAPSLGTPSQNPRPPAISQPPASSPRAPGAPSPFDDLAPSSPPPRSAPPTAVTARPEKPSSGSNVGVLVGIGLTLLGVLGLIGWFVLRPGAPATVHLTTSPVDPVVLFDEQPVQATSSPFMIANVEPGVPHLLEVRKRGFRVWSTTFEVEPGQTLTLPPVTLVPEETTVAANGVGTSGAEPSMPTPPTTTAAGFSLTSDPSGATVFVDGRERGTTPVTLSDLAAGPRQVRVVAAGRLPWESSINIVAGSILPLAPVVLAPAVTVSFTSVPSGAEVTLVRGSTRERVGTTPCETTVDPSADWTVEMESAGYRTWSRELRIRAGSTTHEVDATLAEERVAVVSMRERPVQIATMEPTTSTMVDEPVTPPTMTEAGGSGTLRINSRPWSQVFVDGRLIGNTPQMNISLSAGRHQVTLVNPDFNVRHTISVNVVAGETVTRIEDLPMQ